MCLSDICGERIGHPAVELTTVNITGTILMPHLSFPCNASMRTLQYFAASTSPTSVSVWRWTGEVNTVKLVHIVHIEPPNLGIQQVHLEQMVPVHKSDFIGIGAFDSQGLSAIPLAHENDIGVFQSDLQNSFLLTLTGSSLQVGKHIILDPRHHPDTQLVVALEVQYIMINQSNGKIFPLLYILSLFSICVNLF